MAPPFSSVANIQAGVSSASGLHLRHHLNGDSPATGDLSDARNRGVCSSSGPLDRVGLEKFGISTMSTGEDEFNNRARETSGQGVRQESLAGSAAHSAAPPSRIGPLRVGVARFETHLTE